MNTQTTIPTRSIQTILAMVAEFMQNTTEDSTRGQQVVALQSILANHFNSVPVCFDTLQQSERKVYGLMQMDASMFTARTIDSQLDMLGAGQDEAMAVTTAMAAFYNHRGAYNGLADTLDSIDDTVAYEAPETIGESMPEPDCPF